MNNVKTNGATPLTIAVSLQHREIVTALLKAGADPNQLTFSGLSPLYIACIVGDDKVTKILLETARIRIFGASRD